MLLLFVMVQLKQRVNSSEKESRKQAISRHHEKGLFGLIIRYGTQTRTSAKLNSQ